MLSVLLLFALELLSKHACQNHVVRYKTHRIPCSELSADSRWIGCSINQSDPVNFLSSSSTESLQVAFVPVSITTLLLPAYFLVHNHTENDLLVHSSMISNIDWVSIDTTRDPQLKRIKIAKDTFVNLVSTKIHLILTNCGQPVLEIDRYAFRPGQADQVLVIYHNQTLALEEYFSRHCLTDEQMLFPNESDPSSLSFISLSSTSRKQTFNSTRLIVNGLLLIISLVLSSLLICVAVTQQVHRSSNNIQTKLIGISSPYEMTHIDTASTLISTSESSVSIAPYAPWEETSRSRYIHSVCDHQEYSTSMSRTLIYSPFIATQCSRAFRRKAAREVLRWSESISYPWYDDGLKLLFGYDSDVDEGNA